MSDGTPKPVQPPPLMPWEHEPVVEPEQAVMGFAEVLDNEVFGGQGDEPEPQRRRHPARSEEPDEGPEDEPGDEPEDDPDDEPEDDPDADDPETEDPEEGPGGIEVDLSDHEWQEILAARPHRLKVDGEELEVTYDELLSGYSRTADYTRKTQELAEERRQLRAANAREREKLIEKLRAVEDVLRQSSPERSPEYWDELRAKDPDRYAVEFADAQRAAESQRRLQEARQREENELLEQRREEYREYAAQEFEKLRARMGWKDDDSARESLNAMYAFAKERYGFTDQELAGVVDHRLLVLLHDAQQNVERETRGREKIRRSKKRPASQTLRPGGRVTRRTAVRRGRSREIASAEKALKRSGSISAAARLFEQLLTDED